MILLTFLKFLGKWHGILTSGLTLSCGGYEAFETGKLNSFKVLLTPININFELNLKRFNDFSEGFIETSPLELMNNANLLIFDTDYGE